MSQLCVPVPNASDTNTILDQVFSLCRIPWIYDFVFLADPAADISMLLAPVQKRHALSARIHINATETTSRYAHTFDFNKELIFYSVPAFSVGAITAGFCVEQPVTSSRHKGKGGSSSNLQCIRFVRDDDKGVFLHISENQSRAITEVDCLTHRSSTRRTRVRMRFDYYALRRVLRTPRGTLHPQDVAPSLIYLNYSDEKRMCPSCPQPHAGECGCALRLKRPTHPLDFQFEASNMQFYTGFYQGATVVRLSNAGHCVINATLQSGSVIQGESDRNVISRLHRMAVMDRLSKTKQQPTRMIMPSGELDASDVLATHVQGDEPLREDEDDDDDDFVQALDDGLFDAANGTADDVGAPLMLLEADGSDSHALPDMSVMPDVEALPDVDALRDADARSDSDDAARRLADDCERTGESESRVVEDGQDLNVCREESGRGGLDEVVKNEIRKKRNREAAARSNLKRKLKNESVRRDLALLTQRAVSLRVRETILREENTRLRLQVGRIGSKERN